MFQKVFEYAGPHKKGLYAATAIVLVSVLMGVLPFVLAYQVIAPLVMGESIGASFIISRVALVLACLVLQALFYGWGLNLSHKAAYDTLLRLRTALQKRFEKLPLGVIQDKGTGTVKKLFVDDVDSLEVLLAHSMPEGIANLMIPIAVYVAMFFVDWKLALLSLASIPISLIAMMTMYSVGMKKMGPYYMAGQKMNNTIIEYINGMEVVKVFNKDADSYERFRKDVKDDPIVVLDEATAYADPENEEKMEAAIAELVKGKTLVVIAHKLPAIINADQICVMDHGKLVATGKHQELIQSCPEYQKLWKAAQDSAEWKVHTAKEGK